MLSFTCRQFVEMVMFAQYSKIMFTLHKEQYSLTNVSLESQKVLVKMNIEQGLTIIDFRFSVTSQIVNRCSPDTLCSGQALFIIHFF